MVTGDHMTNLKNWIPLFTIFMTTKLGRVLTTTRRFRTETLKSSSTSCFNLKRIRWYLNYRNTKVTIRRSFIKRFSVKNFAKLLTITFNFFYNTFWWKKKTHFSFNSIFMMFTRLEHILFDPLLSYHIFLPHHEYPPLMNADRQN